MVPRESTVKDVSFEWSHDRILSIFDTPKLKMQDFIIHSGSIKGLISSIYLWILDRDSGAVIGLLALSYLMADEKQGIQLV